MVVAAKIAATVKTEDVIFSEQRFSRKDIDDQMCMTSNQRASITIAHRNLTLTIFINLHVSSMPPVIHTIYFRRLFVKTQYGQDPSHH